MHLSLLAVSLLGAVALAQNCGPSYGNQKCAAGACCKLFTKRLLYRELLNIRLQAVNTAGYAAFVPSAHLDTKADPTAHTV